MIHYDTQHEQAIELIKKHKDCRIKEIRIVEEWRTKEVQIIFSDKATTNENTPPLEALLRGLIICLEGGFKLTLKNEPNYRAWTAEEVPDVAQYREKNNHQVKWFAEKNIKFYALEEARGLYHLYRYEYRTDLSKDEWYPCGVEIKEGAEDAKNS